MSQNEPQDGLPPQEDRIQATRISMQEKNRQVLKRLHAETQQRHSRTVSSQFPPAPPAAAPSPRRKKARPSFGQHITRWLSPLRGRLHWKIAASVLLVGLVTASILWNSVFRAPVLYEKAGDCLYEGDFATAYSLFQKAGRYKDAAAQKKEAAYQEALRLLGKRLYPQAAVYLYALGDYRGADRLVQRATSGSIAAGSAHVLGVLPNGNVRAGGENYRGECSTRKWSGILSVAAGSSHSVGLKADGTVVAVGADDEGQCQTAGWRNIRLIAAGGTHTLGLREDGTVVAVGGNRQGECDVSGWTDIAAVAGGEHHSVGVRQDGTVVATGANDWGQCNVSSWAGIVAVAAGATHTVGLTSTGTVLFAGQNTQGQGNVNDWCNVTAVAAGNDFTVGLKADGTLCYTGNESNFISPSLLYNTPAAAIAAGPYNLVCLLTDGTIRSFGRLSSAQLGTADWVSIGIPLSDKTLK